jgi:dynein heavy chain
MYTFLKIYQLSKFYNTPPRLVVIIKETCNEIIARASEYINGSMVAAALSSGAEDITDVCRKL